MGPERALSGQMGDERTFQAYKGPIQTFGFPLRLITVYFRPTKDPYMQMGWALVPNEKVPLNGRGLSWADRGPFDLIGPVLA